MKKKSLVTLPFLKQTAKKIKKERSLSHTQALNEAAIQFGYTNYQNYLNSIDQRPPAPRWATEEEMDKIYDDRDRIALEKANLLVPLINNFELPIDELLNDLEKVGLSKPEKRSICEKFAIKEFLELHLLKYFLEDEESEIHYHAHYHAPKKVVMKNLEYKKEDTLLRVRGEFDLKLVFAFEYDANDPHEAFKDEDMDGYFEITIDKNKSVVIEDYILGY
ncbi:hypothetical protein [Bdellovibrio sp.]|uniref:hypothetical protein n=1 Tax=Bdellovibrio sp. TaxID=28201 RepID=UPI0032214910